MNGTRGIDCSGSNGVQTTIIISSFDPHSYTERNYGSRLMDAD